MTHVFKRMAKVAFLLLCSSIFALGQVSVLTQHNDNSRTGQNLNEATLNTSNVNQANFGKLFWRTVDGYIYAQPLYVPSVNVAGTVHNVVYVATEHNSVYAFDADDPNAKAPLWHVNFSAPVPSQDICIITGDTDPGDCPYLDLNPEIGITSTPVIDAGTGTLYVVSRTKSITNGSYHFQLHALDITSGIEKFSGPVEIAGQTVGTGVGAVGGQVPFDPIYNVQRPGLLLQNGMIYIAFGSVGDIGTYHGWVMGYNATNLQQTAIFDVSPDGCCGGIWGAGQGVVGDGANNVYVMTADGDFNADTGGRNYGDTFLKLNGNSLTVSDYFTPFNQATLFSNNTDLGSGGPMLLPGTSLLVGMGKDRLLRVVDTTNMGHYNATSNHDVQEFTGTTGTFFGAPVYWNSPNNGPVIYLWGPNDFLKAYKFTGTQFQTTPIATSNVQNSSGFSNAAALSLSANGSTSGSGILWTSASFSGVATGISRPGIVRAFDATDLTRELWNSQQNISRDDVGTYAKFVPPTVVNGKMYMGSFSGQLLVYGLNPPAATGIRFVQAASTSPGTTQATVNTLYPSSQTAGDLNVVIVGWNDTISSVQSITDTAGNVYSLAIGPTTGTGVSQSIYYAKNIAGGTNTVTVVFNQGAANPDVRILEYKGVSISNPLDVSKGGSGNGNIAESGFVTTTSPDELIIGANTALAGSIVAGAPFNTRLMTSPNINVASDRIVNVSGSYDAWVPLKANGNWVMQVVTFRAVGSPTSPTVASVTPNNGPIAGGNSITIAGTNFVSGASVTLGGAAATSVVVVNSTQITAIAPAHAAGAVNVVVTNPDTQSDTLASGYLYVSPSAPTVTSVTPSSGVAAGTTPVTIVGTKFVSGATVSFGGVAATNVVVVSATQITATAPAHAGGAVNVVVTNPDAQSGTLLNGFTYRAAPTVSSVAPNNGALAGGTAVTISGTNFAAGASVTFGGSAATNVVVVSTTQINATTPAHAAGAVNVVVTNTDTQSGTLTSGFTYVTAVSISFGQMAAATPQVPTQVVNLAFPGTQTVGDLNIVVVGWNDVTSTVQSVTDSVGNVYTLAIGPTTGTGLRQSIYYAANIAGGNNTVTVQFNQAAIYPDVRVLEYRGISSVDVTAGASGNSATTSSGAATTTSANELLFAANTVATGNTGAGPGFTTRIITTPDLDIAEDQVVTSVGTYTATAPISPSGAWVMQMVAFRAGVSTAPTVSSVTPNSGSSLGNTSITIAGTNFVSGATVTIGGTAATNVVVVSATQITAKTPAHAAGAVNVVVTNPDTQVGTLTNGFTYVSTAPTISSVTPNIGTSLGGTAVTIAGTNFVSGASVTIGGVAATNVVFVNATQITAKTPAHAVGAVNVVVTNPDTQSGTLTNGFTYISTAPTVSSVTPNSGPLAGGTAVTIAGTNFVSGATVTFGGTAATNIVVVNATQITATVPAHAAGAINVVVTNPDTQTATLTNGYTYTAATAPTVTNVTPNNGVATGGTAVTIAGTNFVSGATVSFGGTAATNVVFVSTTQVTATTPAHAAGAVNVVVTNPDTQSGTLANGFTYRAAPTVGAVTPFNGPLTGGTAVTITGTNFVSGATISFGGTAATNVVFVSATQITATTPAHAVGAVNVIVTNPDTQSGALTNGYTYQPSTAPTITSVTPNSGPITGGAPITITGTNFGGSAGISAAIDGNTLLGNITLVSSTQITAVMPAHAAGAVSISVTDNDAQNGIQTVTLANAFTYRAAPTVISVTPNNGPLAGGTPVTITGANFGTGDTVAFSGTPATGVVVVSPTQITAVAPAHAAGLVNVAVTDPFSQFGNLSSAFTYTASVTVGYAQVAAATPQTPTQVVNLAFPSAQTLGDLNVVVVGWNDVTSTVQSVTDSLGNVYSLAVGPVTGTGLRQSIYYAPNITGGANTVTVRFSQAAAYPDVRILEYRGVSSVDVTASASGSGVLTSVGPITTTSANELIFAANTVSTGATAAGTGFTSRIITTPDLDIAEDMVATSAGSYTATSPIAPSGNWVMQVVAFKAGASTAPAIIDVSPDTGTTLGGTSLAIEGMNFVPGATVTIGGTPATTVTVIDPTFIIAISPAHAAGLADVVVTNPDTQSATLTNEFTYVSTAPNPSSVTPNNGLLAGGTAVTISGTNFVAGATVTFGGVPATNVVVFNQSQINATTPAHAAGNVNVVITNPDAQVGTLTNGYTYITATAPTVTSVTPNGGALAGGTAVTITGTNFANGATVSFGGFSATGVVVVSATQITATTPAHASGPVNVVVTNPDTQSNTLTSGFTYRPAPVVSGISSPFGPPSGGVGVTINGSNFVAGANVTFGGTPGTNILVLNSTQILVTIPAHAAGLVNIAVTNPDSQSGTLTNGFNYAFPPTITSITPNSGPFTGGTAVTITGTNFVSGTTVFIAGAPALNVVVVSATKITATTPPSATGSTVVSVITPDTQTAFVANGFTYTAPPTVNSVTPNNGPLNGGTTVTLTGFSFVSGASVSFGGTPATNVFVTSSTQITATTPAHAAGAVNVVVTNPDTQSGTLTNGFTYTTAVGMGFGQIAAATPQVPTQVVTLAYPGAQTVGDLNVVVVGWNDVTSTVQSVTDSAGNVYSLAIGPTTGTGLRQSIYYAANIKAGSNTVTVQFNQPAVYPDIRILEYRGVSAVDVTAGASGNSATTSSGAVTTTSASELIVAANTVATGNTAAGAGFTARIITTPDLDLVEDQVVTTTGSYTATAPISPTGAWVMQIVTFK